MTRISNAAIIRRQEKEIAELERLVSVLQRKNEELSIALIAERQAQIEAARRRSWGNGEARQ